ncbi:MAG: ELM1/GtrOC1 family putative glycosyltransferase [Pseudomonadota bacterium]
MSAKGKVCRIGVVSDGKPGHVNQSLGLAEALQRLCRDLHITRIPAMSAGQALARALVRRSSGAESGVSLLLGAGHRTHASLLALRRIHSCPAVVLMSPSLPGSFFDLVIVPRHDGGCETDRFWFTDGPINRIRPAKKRPGLGLMLVGGPSPHFDWRTNELVEQIAKLCDGTIQWELSTSRRTPPDFLRILDSLHLPGLDARSPEQRPEDWLPSVLPGAETCWVSPDSVSMVYEALSSGAAVGIFDLPPVTGSRVAESMADLVCRGLLASSSQATTPGALAPSEQVFSEADRIARKIVDLGWLEC